MKAEEQVTQEDQKKSAWLAEQGIHITPEEIAEENMYCTDRRLRYLPCFGCEYAAFTVNDGWVSDCKDSPYGLRCQCMLLNVVTLGCIGEKNDTFMTRCAKFVPEHQNEDENRSRQAAEEEDHDLEDPL